jgi:type II secretory pathway pseudopilin PulG
MELVTAIAVICILAILIFPAFAQIRGRIERVNCSNNLHQLYVGAAAYYQQNRHWPQINPALLGGANNAYDEAWIEVYLPFGIERATWICPTIQRSLGNPDFTKPQNYRADYIAMPYDSKPLTPTTWPSQPWFAERGNVHGTGNLVILANGSVTDLKSMDPVAAAANGL